MRITNIKVVDLFGNLSYECTLNDAISLLTSQNGGGKTTLMNLIQFIFTPNNETFNAIKDVQFNSLSLTMDSGIVVSFSRLKAKNKNILFKNDYRFTVGDESLIYSELYKIATKIAIGYNKPIILMNYIWIKQKEMLHSHDIDLNILYIKPDDCYGNRYETALSEMTETIAKDIFESSIFDMPKHVILSDITGPFSIESSGLKHWTLMFYNLVFKSNSNTLVLIDEPEASLHICLQEKFLDEVIRLQKIFKMSVFVATHSPNIVNSHYDLILEKRTV